MTDLIYWTFTHVRTLGGLGLAFLLGAVFTMWIYADEIKKGR
ncbi:hypothetical protein [Schleiferilactobacillus harbinensis]|uniref:Uncharacterized protein n=1 Tax=Schleiferilactobacillus harbinensis TaxID=304207 RepID=A0ABU7SVF1_9LACO